MANQMPVGAHQMSQTEMRGGSYPGMGEDETQVLQTVQGYKNPGPTENQRGIEANTNRTNGTAITGPPPSNAVTAPEAPAIECDC